MAGDKQRNRLQELERLLSQDNVDPALSSLSSSLLLSEVEHLGQSAAVKDVATARSALEYSSNARGEPNEEVEAEIGWQRSSDSSALYNDVFEGVPRFDGAFLSRTTPLKAQFCPPLIETLYCF